MKLAGLALLAASAFAEGKLPDGPGKATFVKVCGACHGLDAVTGMGHDRAGWKDIVDEMVDKGATATPAEVKQIVAWLAKAFPRKPR
jgi:mono/diheme cytochrome c family protein